MQDAADSEECASQQYGSSPAQEVSNDQADKGTKNTSNGVSGHDLALNCSVWVVERLEEVWV